MLFFPFSIVRLVFRVSRVYPLRFEQEQSVSLDLGWGEGRGGLDKGIVFMPCLRFIYTGTVDCQVSCLFYLKDFSLIVVS